MIAAASVASASTVFSFTGVNYSPGPGSVPAQTVGGVSVTATAFWANVNNSGATVTGSSNDLASTWIGAASGFGLGVCNPNAQSTCGSSPTSQVNNYQGLDFVNFAFNTSVNLNSVYVQGFGNPESFQRLERCGFVVHNTDHGPGNGAFLRDAFSSAR